MFLENLKALCLSIDWVPKLIQKFFPTMEQKLVQRCETEIVADACNASYLFDCIVMFPLNNSNLKKYGH